MAAREERSALIAAAMSDEGYHGMTPEIAMRVERLSEEIKSSKEEEEDWAAAFRAFIGAGERLLDRWPDEVTGYPSYLPSFDEVLMDLGEIEPVAEGPQFVIHPFDDEWLWDESGEKPLLLGSVEEAAAKAHQHKVESPMSLIGKLWYAIYQLDPKGPDQLAAMISPSGEMHREHPQTILNQVGRSGEWPGDEYPKLSAKIDEPNPALQFIAPEIRERIAQDEQRFGPAVDIAIAGDHISIMFQSGHWLGYGEEE